MPEIYQVSNPITELKSLAEAHGIEFKDCENGHIQLTAHGNLFNYWPNSKKKTLYSPTLDLRENHVTPWDAIRLCMSKAKPGMRPKQNRDIPKNKPSFELKAVNRNPAGLKHLYIGDIPPWEGAGFGFGSAGDELRHQAYQKTQEAIILRAQADEMDKAA